ncbi:adenylate/guanylate cyclase domain-containing protein [Rhodospirillum centenum]|uniref:Adenylate cyclase n=1 Tax=Rhodospirillum centenum (strain ATCC 51521 / SW) TaxID=414684 RepID=B6ISG2_RHOCS|nr:adenylate/guanylate cyclase domain-containing protein [Rhodospirillum centenum]ACI98398.1 adenylate cyclase [Rhodospirillum centenum SW]
MSEPAPASRLSSFRDWLLHAGTDPCDLDALLPRICSRLCGLGLPLDRVSLNLEMLHPEIGGHGRVWLSEGGGRVSLYRAPRGLEMSEDYLASPVRIVDETDRPFRQHLETGDAGMPLLRRLRKEGFTDYFIAPFPFQERERTAAMSFATTRPGGFTPADLADLETVARMLCPHVEARVVAEIARDLMTTYLGRGPGERVFRGQIRRGDCTSIFAAICFCDLRGFTAFTQENASDRVIQRLNCWFDLAVEAVEGQGGEVLKFMGDGLLAIFPAEELNPREACHRALEAADRLSRGVDGFNAAPPDGMPPLDYGLSLHLGYVAFGNIGGPRRLDFTVVGPAVNLASRLLDVAKGVERRVVVSAEFAGCSGRNDLHDLGSHALRGLDRPVSVYGLP